MSQNAIEDEADDFMSSWTPQKDDESDGCGVPDRKTKCLLVTFSNGDTEGFSYHCMDGFTLKPWGMTLIFRSVKEWPDKDGELKKYQTFWEITVTGKNLGIVVKQVSELIRYTLFPGGVAEDGKPYITKIERTPFEPQHGDDLPG